MKPQFKQIVIVFISIFLLSYNTEETPSETAVTPEPVIPPTTVPNLEIQTERILPKAKVALQD